MTSYAPTMSAWDAAMNPDTSSNTNDFGKTYFGKVQVAVNFISLVKGVGRVPWEPNQLTPDGKPTRKNTGIDIHLICKSKEGAEYTVDRNYIAEFGDWPDLLLPNLKNIGVTSLQELNGKFAQVELVENGESFVNKAGETKKKTTFKFIKTFGTEAELNAAREALFGGNGAQTAPTPAAQTPAPAANVNPEKATAERFLKAYVDNAMRSAGNDVIKARDILGPMIAKQALLAKYFTVDSPEVIGLMAPA